jgi:isocitrate dehydrogenase kinase/phosphatase
MEFDRDRFSAELLRELAASAGRMVRCNEEKVIIEHAYVERRVTPLDLYIGAATADEARAAVLDYGDAIRDLAATNIFAGDLLLKNFGVTRHRRVVFYDYDEIRPLTSCRFRAVPPARTDDDEYAAEPWYHVNENDVFPEEFVRFLGLPSDLYELFAAHHGELLTLDYWRQMQERLLAGERIHIYPYSRRLRPHPAEAGLTAQDRP